MAPRSSPLERYGCQLLIEIRTQQLCLLHFLGHNLVFHVAHSFDVVLISCSSGYDGLRPVESMCIPETQVRIAHTAVSHGSSGP